MADKRVGLHRQCKKPDLRLVYSSQKLDLRWIYLRLTCNLNPDIAIIPWGCKQTWSCRGGGATLLVGILALHQPKHCFMDSMVDPAGSNMPCSPDPSLSDVFGTQIGWVLGEFTTSQNFTTHREEWPLLDVLSFSCFGSYGGFHSHGGTRKWLVYNGKNQWNGWFGVPLFQETSIYLHCYSKKRSRCWDTQLVEPPYPIIFSSYSHYFVCSTPIFDESQKLLSTTQVDVWMS